MVSVQEELTCEQFITHKQDVISYTTVHRDSTLPVYKTLLCVTEPNKDKGPQKSLDCLSVCALSTFML